MTERLIKSPERQRAWHRLRDALDKAGVFACLTNAEQVLVWVDGVGVLRLVAGVSGLLWRIGRVDLAEVHRVAASG